MSKQPLPNEQRILLTNISWHKYEQLLTEMGSERTTRFTFDRGRLEMMNPLEEHDRYHKLIESMILVVADVLNLQVTSYKTPLLKRSDLQVGAEPDTGYYIQHGAKVYQKVAIDLTSNPPPDLLVEIELSKSQLNKAAIYAKLGVPEVWHYASQPGNNFLKGKLSIYSLDSQQYVEVSQSLALPILPAHRILQFIHQSDTLGLVGALRSLREWLQE